MDVAGESLLIGNALEQGGELLLLGLGECGEQQPLMLTRDVADSGEGLLSFFREKQGVTAAVVRVGGTLDETVSAELVEESHEATGHHTEPAGECLLGEARSGGEDVEDAGMRRREVQLREALGIFAGRMAA